MAVMPCYTPCRSRSLHTSCKKSTHSCPDCALNTGSPVAPTKQCFQQSAPHGPLVRHSAMEYIHYDHLQTQINCNALDNAEYAHRFIWLPTCSILVNLCWSPVQDLCQPALPGISAVSVTVHNNAARRQYLATFPVCAA